MKILHLSHSDIAGGAARASYRLHEALLKSNIDSNMMVRNKYSNNWSVSGPNSVFEKLLNKIRAPIGKKIDSFQKTKNNNFHSGGWVPSNWSSIINRSDYDIVHLHWISNETMSIADIGKIKKPIIWTMHDMWPFTGSEHYAPDDEISRWKHGYNKSNKPLEHKGLDIDRIVWQKKIKKWHSCDNFHLISPSKWLAECAQQSVLFQHTPISVIPNTLDTDIFKPLDSHFCRQAFNLPPDKHIILFGAIGGTSDLRKGYDLLTTALQQLSKKVNINDFLCVIFGQDPPKITSNLPFTTKWVGHISDDITLSLLYNSASVMIVPSRQEAFGQTASEAQSCGCPVVSFASTGLTDIVQHMETGYLANAFDPIDLANGIQFVLKDKLNNNNLSINAYKRSKLLYSQDVVVQQHVNLYQEIII